MTRSRAAQSASQAEDDPIGHVLDGRYAIEARLGQGGLGVVYRALQTRLGRPVAVKVLHAEHAKRRQLRERFDREARSLARLAHPNIVDVIDYGIDGEAPFLVMELLEGRPLDSAIRRGLAPDEGLAIGLGVVEALAYAHDQGVVHRDLKPGNIFLQQLPDGSESPRVLDFGLAKFVGESTDGDALTRSGAILGTPAYMSPEQATGASSDVRADVYSLGIVLYELLTGNRPFIGPPSELLRMHLLSELPPLPSALAGLPDAKQLEAVLRRATAKSASERYADAGELLEALAPFATERRSRTSASYERRRGRAHADTRVDGSGLAPQRASRVESPRGGPGSPHPGPARRRAGPALLAASGLAAALVLVALGLWYARGRGAQAPEAAAATALEPAPPERRREPEKTQAPSAEPDPAEERAGGPEHAEDGTAEAAEGAQAPLVAPSGEEEPLSGPGRGDEPPMEETSSGVAAENPVAPAQELRPDPPPNPYELPPELAGIKRRYRPGARLGRGDRVTLFRYASSHPGDPRAWLLMAHIDFEFGARSDALRFYGNALDADAGASADPTMRRDLIVMAGHRRVGAHASAMVEELYGRGAIPELDSVLEEAALDEEELQRLERLRARLLSMEAR